MSLPSNNSRKTRRAIFTRISDRLHQLLTGALFGKYKKLFIGFFVLISVVVISQLLIANWETLREYQWELKPGWILATVIFFLVDLLIATWGWHLFVARLTGFRDFRKSAKICWSSNLARRIPGPIWYIAGRALLYEKEGVAKTTTSILSALELAFFLVSGLITALLTLPFWLFQTSSEVSGIGIFVALLPLSIVAVHPQILAYVWQKASREPVAHRLLWRDTITWLIVYIMTWVVGAFVLFSVINIIYPLPFSQLAPTIGIWSLAGSLSLAGALTISIIGLREVSLAILLTQIVPAPIALIVAIGIRLVWLLGELFSALIALKL